MKHTEELSLRNASSRARDIAVRECGFDPSQGHVPAAEQQRFHAVYDSILGELMTALDPEAF